MKSHWAFLVGVIFGFVLATPGCAQVSMTGVTVSGTVSVGQPESQATMPAFSPAGTTYTSPQLVTIACSNPSCVIYFTTDGSQPTTNSSIYSGPISIPTTLTLQAIAVAPGSLQSQTASAEYIINTGSILATPSSINFGTITIGNTSATQSVTINNSTGSSVSFSGAGITGIEAGDFSIASTTCTSPIPSNTQCTYSLTYSPTAAENDAATFGITIASNLFSAALSGTGQTAGISFSPVAGTYTGPQTVAINYGNACSAGQTELYTTDGTDPTITSPIYTGPVAITASGTLKAGCATIGARQNNVQASTAAAVCHTVNGGNFTGPPATSCDAIGTSGGIGTVNPQNVAWSIGSTSQMSITAPPNTGTETQMLFTMLFSGNADPSAPKCDDCTESVKDIIFTVTGTGLANMEFDSPWFDKTHGRNMQDGTQCQGSSGFIEVDSGNAGGWTQDRNISCANWTPGTTHHILNSVSHIINDTGCGGNGCAYYNYMWIDAKRYAMGGTYGGTQGYKTTTSGAWGMQFQPDMSPTGSSAVTGGWSISSATVALGYGDETTPVAAAFIIN